MNYETARVDYLAGWHLIGSARLGRIQSAGVAFSYLGASMNNSTRWVAAAAMAATVMTATAQAALADPDITSDTVSVTGGAVENRFDAVGGWNLDQHVVAATTDPVNSTSGGAPVSDDNDKAQTDINNALSQAANEFMLGVTVGTMAGGVVGLVGGCVVGAVIGAIGGCIPGLAIGAGVGPIIGGVVVGVPAGIAALVQAYNTLHAAGEISAPAPASL